jgi:hypothetical protein
MAFAETRPHRVWSPGVVEPNRWMLRHTCKVSHPVYTHFALAVYPNGREMQLGDRRYRSFVRTGAISHLVQMALSCSPAVGGRGEK